MAIVNRDGDASEQKEWVNFISSYGTSGLGVQVGVTLMVAGPMPFPYSLQSIDALSLGASGAPQLSFNILRVIAGGGITMIAVSISNMIIRGGASFAALASYSGLAPQGSTLLLGQRGDVLSATTAGANTACSQLLIQMTVKKTQDIVSHNGVAG